MKPVAAISVGIGLALCVIAVLGLVDLMALETALLSVATHIGPAGG
jgi:hypothetical protein